MKERKPTSKIEFFAGEGPHPSYELIWRFHKIPAAAYKEVKQRIGIPTGGSAVIRVEKLLCGRKYWVLGSPGHVKAGTINSIMKKYGVEVITDEPVVVTERED